MLLLGDGKILLVAMFLYKNLTNSNTVSLTINNLVEECGYRPDSHKGKNNDQFKEMLSILIKNEYVSSSFDISLIKPTEFFQVRINKDALFDTPSNFVMLEETEFNRIIHSKSNIDKASLLLGFLSIKKYINMSPNATKLCAPSINTLRSDFNVGSNATVRNIIDELENLCLIYRLNCGCHKQDGSIRNTPTCYALEEKALRGAEVFLETTFKIDDIMPYVYDGFSKKVVKANRNYHESTSHNEKKNEELVTEPKRNKSYGESSYERKSKKESSYNNLYTPRETKRSNIPVVDEMPHDAKVGEVFTINGKEHRKIEKPFDWLEIERYGWED